MEIGDRIHNIMKIKGLNLSSYANILGVSHTTVKKTIDGTTKPGFDFIKKVLETAPAINPEWLIHGEGEMMKSKEYYKEAANAGVNVFSDDKVIYGTKAKTGIPLLKNVGFGGNGDEFQDTNNIVAYFNLPDTKAEFIIKLNGDSMEPNFKSGDYLACMVVAHNSFIQWGKVFIIFADQGQIVKILKPGKNGDIECHSYNDNYPMFTIKKEDIKSLAMVVAKVTLY